MTDDERRQIQERVRVEEGERARLQGSVAGVMAFGSFAVSVGAITYIGGASGCMAAETVHHGELLTGALVLAAALVFVRAKR